jgi:branched-chain amino acid transport system substrate-binding protein
MARESIAGLIAQLYGAKISRREFGKRAVAAGLSVGLVGNVLAVHAARAQDEMPESTQIGVPDVGHTTDTSKGTIKLYSSWPYSGAMERIGGHAVAATEMCLEDFGFAAGGFQIEYEALDDGIAANEGRWDPGKETENANTAINDEDAMVYLGTYNSGAAAISIPIMNEAGMAMISFANTYPGLTKAVENATEEGEPDLYYPTGTRNYMRVCPADDVQGGAGARWAIAEGHTRAYILHDNSLYGQGVATIFGNVFEEEGGTVLGMEGYDFRAGDYQALMTSIAASGDDGAGPDVLYLGATVDNNAAKVLQDMRGVMSVEDVAFIGPDGLNTQTFVQGAAGAAEGAYITFGGYSADKLIELGGPGADYTVRVRERLGLGENDQPDAYAVYAYESMVVVLQAIEQVGEKDRAAILDVMFNTEGFVSLLGDPWSFTDEGDIDAPKIGLLQINDDIITFVDAIA